MGVRPSPFNFDVVLPDGTTLLFNSFTLTLLVLDLEEAGRAREILAAATRSAEPGDTQDLADLLFARGFLVDERIDELAILKRHYQRSCAQTRNLTLTIAPTLNCNLRCSYCYQQRSPERMNRAVESALVEFVRDRLEPKGTLAVVWFGGEPMLAMRTIESLSEQFLRICNERDAGYRARIITNGYFLDRNNAQRLKRAGVGSAQVTLDGPPDVHDRRRPAAGGKGTFDRLLQNLKESSPCLNVSVRMNVDHSNLDRVDDLLALLRDEGLSRRLSFYLGHTYPFTEACADMAGTCLGDEEFSLLTLEAQMKVLEAGFGSYFVLPKAKGNYCMADMRNAWVVTPSGGLANCWNEVHDKGAEVGHLLEPDSPAMAANRRRWEGHRPFDLECRGCRLLPICMGGCPFLHLTARTLDCHEWKHHPAESLAVYYFVQHRRRESNVLSLLAEAVAAVRELESERSARSEFHAHEGEPTR